MWSAAGMPASVAATSGTRKSARRLLRHVEVGFPGGHVAVGVHARAHVHQRRRALRVPAVLVGARPLHAHRLADRLGEQRGVGGGVLVAVAAIAAGAFEIDAAHLVGRQREHLRQLLAQSVGRLRSRPGGQLRRP